MEDLLALLACAKPRAKRPREPAVLGPDGEAEASRADCLAACRRLADRLGGALTLPPAATAWLPPIKTESVQTIFAVLEAAAVFVVSRTWADLIAGTVLHLHSVPYCNGYIAEECTESASALNMFIYAICTIPIAALVHFLVAKSGLTKRPGMWEDISMMLNYIVGWAWGNAFVQLLQEITTNDDGLAFITSDGKRNFFFFNLFFTMMVTVGSGIIIILVMPYTKDMECGDGPWTEYIEDWLEATWSMVTRACSVSAMVLWYYTVSTIVFLYVPAGHVLAQEVQLLYAVSLTTVGMVASVALERMELRFKADSRLSPARVEAVVVYSDLTQHVIGYLVGCAWSDFLFSLFRSLLAPPTAPVMALNILITAVVTFAVVYFLGAASPRVTEDYNSQEAAEQYFIYHSMGFFVGWLWLVITRNIFAQLSLAFQYLTFFMDSHLGFAIPTFVGDTLVVLIFSPLTTIFFFWLAGSISALLEKRLDVPRPPSKGYKASLFKRKWKAMKSSGTV